VQVDAVGGAAVSWNARNIAGSYTLTGVRGAGGPLATLADSAGRVVLRRTVVVNPAAADATFSAVQISAATVAVNGTATVTITLRDAFNNLLIAATPADFTATVTRGTLTGVTCAGAVCTGTYTAPATAGADALTVRIATVDVINSPIAITVP
jgi:hypothetical protein